MASKLTNKFTKSVLEREQKEQKSIESIVPVIKQPADIEKMIEATSEQVPVLPAEPIQFAEEPTTITPPPVIKQQSTPIKKTPTPTVMNLDAFLNPSENRQAKNKTFYLDTAVIDAIKQAATANHMAESKLVNDILKKVLGA